MVRCEKELRLVHDGLSEQATVGQPRQAVFGVGGYAELRHGRGNPVFGRSVRRTRARAGAWGSVTELRNLCAAEVELRRLIGGAQHGFHRRSSTILSSS